jgi:hypothetical protein
MPDESALRERVERDSAHAQALLSGVGRAVVGQRSSLEAMEERQVTVGGTTFPLPRPFLVLASEDPIALEGTYPPLRPRWTASCSRHW